MQLDVDIGYNRLNPVISGPAIENEKSVTRLTLSLVHKHGALDVGLVPLIVDVFVQRNLEKNTKIHFLAQQSKRSSGLAYVYRKYSRRKLLNKLNFMFELARKL